MCQKWQIWGMFVYIFYMFFSLFVYYLFIMCILSWRLFIYWQENNCLFTRKKIIGEQEKGRKKFIGWQLLAGDKQKAIVWEYKYFCFRIQIFLLQNTNIFASEDKYFCFRRQIFFPKGIFSPLDQLACFCAGCYILFPYGHMKNKKFRGPPGPNF